MPIGSGLSAQAGWAEETTYGTFVTPAMFAEFNSETLALAKNVAQSAGLRAGGRVARVGNRVVTTRAAAGALAMDVSSRGMGKLLKHMLGTPSPTAVVIGATGIYRQIHVPGDLAGRSLAFQIGRPQSDGTVRAYSYPGAKFTGWELACAVDQILGLTLNVDARTEDTGQALGTVSYTTANEEKFHFGQLAIAIGGTVATTAGRTTVSGSPAALLGARGFSLKASTPLDASRFFAGGGGLKSDQIENGWRTYTLDLDTEFISKTQLYDAFAADTTVTIQITLTGTVVVTGGTAVLRITIPAGKLDSGSPQVGGPDVIKNPVTLLAMEDGTNPVIQIEYESPDATVL